MAKLDFNAEDAPESEFEVLPAGDYACQIIQSEMKETKAGTGQYLELRIQVLDEPYTGRLVFDRLNLINPNETAVKIAQRTLADICKAVGVLELEDSEELHGIEFTARLKVKPAQGDFPEGNEVGKYLPAEQVEWSVFFGGHSAILTQKRENNGTVDSYSYIFYYLILYTARIILGINYRFYTVLTLWGT